MPTTSLDELNALAARVKKAQRTFAAFTQEQVDIIFRNAAPCCLRRSHPAGENGRRRDGDGCR
jgi:hypothetical protein